MSKFLIKKHRRWLIWGSFGLAINTPTLAQIAVDDENNENRFFIILHLIKRRKKRPTLGGSETPDPRRAAHDTHLRAEPLALTSQGWEGSSPAGSLSPGCRTPQLTLPPPITSTKKSVFSSQQHLRSSPLITPTLWSTASSSPSCVRVIYPATNKVLLRSIGL